MTSNMSGMLAAGVSLGPGYAPGSTLEAAHTQVDVLESELRQAMPEVGTITSHIEPAAPSEPPVELDAANSAQMEARANKLLTEASVSVLGQLCALHGKLVQLWAAGETPTGHLLAQYRNLVNDFGLPPIANGRLKTSNKPTQTNKFERFKQRPG